VPFEVANTWQGILIGGVVTFFLFAIYVHRVQEPKFSDDGEYILPEKRLHPAMVGSFFIPICLFWFGWSARPDIHWIMPIIGSSFFSVGAFLLFVSFDFGFF
jgi:MFS transporter, DHA1 family, multidrug resistance protein